MSSKMKIVSATVIAAALLATVAVARTVHTHAGTGPQAAQSTVGAAPVQALPRPHANFACPLANETECEKLDWFPE